MGEIKKPPLQVTKHERIKAVSMRLPLSIWRMLKKASIEKEKSVNQIIIDLVQEKLLS